MLAIVLALAAAVTWGCNPLIARRAMLKADVMSTNFYGIIAGLVVVAIYSFFSGEMASLPTIPSEQILTFAVVGISTIVLGRTFYYLSINRIGAGPSISISASSILVAPAIAFLWLNEVIDLKTAMGILMVFAGIFFIARRET